MLMLIALFNPSADPLSKQRKSKAQSSLLIPTYLAPLSKGYKNKHTNQNSPVFKQTNRNMTKILQGICTLSKAHQLDNHFS
jgi:hypothetical protein